MIAHDDMGQTRKGTGARYWTHPHTVSDILEGYGIEDEDILSAATLHDTMEDTEVSYSNIKDIFDKKVADLVKEVTNSPDLDGLGKEDYMNEKLLRISDDALLIKLGDMLHNCGDKPRLNQIERMKNNLKFLLRKRKGLKEIHRDLIDSFFSMFDLKSQELVNLY